MKIYLTKYGWQTTAHSENKDGSKNRCYFDCTFKRSTEPHDEIEGELIFHDKSGIDRPCFISSYKKQDGTIVPKLVLLDPKDKPKEVSNPGIVQQTLSGDGRDAMGHMDINPDDLPFY